MKKSLSGSGCYCMKAKAWALQSISYLLLLMLLLPCVRGQLYLVLSNRIVGQIKQVTLYLGEFLHNSGVY